MANLLSTTVNGQLNTGNVIDLGYTVNGSIATTAFRGINFHSFGDLSYYIGKPSGAWTQPLHIHFYTGIWIRSHHSYGGTRFYNIATGSQLMSVGDGSDIVNIYSGLTVNGSLINTGASYLGIIYDYDNNNYYLNPNGTSVVDRVVTTGRLEVTYNADRYQMNFLRGSGSNWWVTNDSASIGLHLNNVGDKFYFNTDGDFYSTANGWLSTALGAKQNASTAITTSNIGSQSVNYANSAGSASSVAWSNVSGKPSLDYQQEYTFTAPASPDGSGYVWLRVPMGGFNAGGDFVRFSIGRAIFWNGSNPYGGPSMDVVAYSREWHGGQQAAVITYAEHGSVPGAGWVTNAGPRDLASGGYWFYMRIWAGVDYAMRVYRGSGQIGTSWEQSTDPGAVYGLRPGVNNVGPDYVGFNTNGSVHATRFYDYDDTGYYVDPNNTSNLAASYIGRVLINYDGTDTWFRMQSGNRMRITTTGGTDFIIPNTGEMTYNGNTVIHTGNIGSQSVSYASSAGNADTVDSLHASDFVRAYTTTSDNIDANWGQSFKTFDPVPSGTPPIASPNLRTINVGEDYNRRTQMAFTYSEDRAWFRRRTEAGWGSWREFIHSGNIASQSVSYADESGYSASSGSVEWTSVQNKPATFPPSAHNHDDRYYTESESDTRYAYKEGSSGTNFYANAYYQYEWTRIMGSGSKGIYWQEGDGAYWHIYPRNQADMRFRTGSGNGGIVGTVADETARGYIHWTTSNEIGFLSEDRNWVLRTWNRGVEAYGSMRAPIFYDSSDTNYYVDPNSTSNLLTVNVLNTYVGNAIYFGGGNNYFNWTSGRIHSNVGIQSENSMRAPIFYDSNNTDYYLDPNANSVLSTVQFSDGITDNGTVRIYMPGGAWSVNSPSGTGGAIKISLPTGAFGVNTMMSMTVQVYEYSTGQSFTIRLGGYNYYNHSWYNVFAYMVNDSGKGGDVPVYFGHDGTRDVIWIGEPGWSWSYPNVFVTDFQAGHSQSSTWKTGWNVSFDTGSRTNVTQSRTAYRQIDKGNIATQAVSYADDAGFADNADTVDGYHMNQALLTTSSPTFQEVYANGWFRTTGYQGLYNPTNNAHFYPNSASYGSWRIDGTRNGWHGLHFDSGSTLMMNSAETGIHREGYGWQFRWYNGSMYVSRGTYGGGTEYTVIDSGTIGSQSVSYATDSGSVDGIDSSRIVYGDGERKSSEGYSDMNRYNQASGFYFYNNPSNNPFGDWTNWINVMGNSWASNYGFQLAHQFHGEGFMVRRVTNGTFYSWRTIIDSGNILGQTVNYVTVNYNNDSNSTYQLLWGSGNSVYGTGDVYVNPFLDRVYAKSFETGAAGDAANSYRCRDTGGTSRNAMFVNSSNQLQIGNANFSNNYFVGSVGVNVSPSATAGRIDASNDIVAYSSSDERLKHNITPIENAIDKVKSLTGVEFDWKPEYKHAHGYEGHDTGIIAQQVQEVIPSAVRTNDTGFLAVRYEKLIGLLIEANKELAARVEELEKKLG